MKYLCFLTLILMFFVGCTGIESSPDDDPPRDTTGMKITTSFVQKGPFVQGSSVTIQEISDSFNPIGRNYSTSTIDDFGSFSFTGSVGTKYVEIISEGYYFNEVLGAISPSELTLRVIKDVSADTGVNINILTTLEKDRVQYLMSNGGMEYADAKSQADVELLKIFNIPDEIIAETIGFEKMDISKPGDSNAILLAISAVLQGDNSVGELTELISKISMDIKEDGTLDGESYINELRTNAQNLDLSQIRTNLENRYQSLNLTVSIPAFENFVDSDGDGIINKYDFQLVSPSGTIDDTTPVFDWSDSEYAGIKYHLVVSENSDFSAPVIDQTDLTESTYTATEALKNTTTYYWRVLLIKDTDELTWGGNGTFTVDLGSVTLSAPTGTITDTKPVFDWSDTALTGATYDIQIASDAGFTTIVESTSDLTASTYTLTTATLDNLTTYYYRVAVVDANSIQGAWTTAGSFSVDLGSVTLSAPTGTITDTKPVFDWSDTALTGATYEIEIASDAGFTTIIEDASGLTASTYTLTTATLDNLTTYYYRVAVVDTNSVQGAWTSAGSFSIDLGTVTLTGPVAESLTNDTTPTFTWGTKAIADVYTVTISTNADLSTPVLTINDISAGTYTLSGTGGEVLADTDSTIYYWAVKFTDENGVVSENSTISNFELDTTSPAGSIVINNNDTETERETVELTISATDVNTVTEMYISKDGSFTDGAWEEYVTSATVEYSTLTNTENGVITTYIKFKDGVGNESGAITDTITLNRTLLSGNIFTNTTWQLSDSPFILRSNVAIAYGATLTIEPGVTLEGDDFEIQVYGNLDMIGTSGNLITCNNLNVVPGDNTDTEPYVITIQYAEYTGGSIYKPTGGSPYGSLILRDSVLQNFDSTAYIYLWYPTADCYIERNIFINCGGISTGTMNGIKVYIRNNVFKDSFGDNGNTYAIKNWASYDTTEIIAEYNSFLSTDKINLKLEYSDCSITATNNYWGTTDTSVIDTMIYDKNDDFSLPVVITYTPILTEPHVNTPDPSAYIQ